MNVSDQMRSKKQTLSVQPNESSVDVLLRLLDVSLTK